MKLNSYTKKLNLFDGMVTYDNFDINENVPLDKQLSSLREDMLQIEFGDRFTLDVGWQPDFDPDGYFIVYAIQDCDWEDSLSKEKCCTLKDLKIAIEKAAKLIDSMRKIKDLPFRNVEYEEF